MTGTASATASYLALSAYASGTWDDYAPQSYQVPTNPSVLHAVSAAAIWTDLWTVTGSPSNGLIQLTFDVTGSTTQSGPLSSAASILFNNGNGSGHTGDFTQVFSTVFTAGSATSLSVTLLAAIALIDRTQTGPYDAYATVDFSHTLRLVDVKILDSANNPILGAGVTTQSGTILPLNIANTRLAVAEPENIALLGGGLMALFAARRRKRVRAD